jgi:hypothetical protein
LTIPHDGWILILTPDPLKFVTGNEANQEVPECSLPSVGYQAFITQLLSPHAMQHILSPPGRVLASKCHYVPVPNIYHGFARRITPHLGSGKQKVASDKSYLKLDYSDDGVNLDILYKYVRILIRYY